MPSTKTTFGCPVEAALSVIGGKWKMLILWNLLDKPCRYGELRRLVPSVTEKMLIQQLRQLEEDGLIERQQFNEVPPRVVYGVTETGMALGPIIRDLGEWSKRYIPR